MEGCLKENNGIIMLLRFPLIVGVVFVHSLSITHGFFKVYDFCYYSITEILCGLCVPLFFFFSGYLFFLNIESFSFSVYKKKLRRRIKTLLIPYVFWNLFVVAVIGIGQLLMPSLFTGAFKSVSNFTAKDWLSIFYCSLGSSQPIAFQLWFIRDLMVMMIITPMIYFLCKYLNYWWLFVLFLMPLIGVNRIFLGLNFFALSFFAAGCWFGINKKSFLFQSVKARYTIISFFLLTFIIDVFFHEFGFGHGVFHGLNKIIGCIAIIQFVSISQRSNLITRLWYMKPVINSSTFFIYSYHGIFVAFITNTVKQFVNCDLSAVFWYFMIVIILVAFGIIAYNVMLKYFPVITNIITGGRT